MNVLRKIKAAYHWALARDDEMRHGPEAALTRLARVEALRPLTYYGSAYKAHLLFHAGRTAEADELFNATEQRLANPKNADESYVRLFCQFCGRFRVGTLEEADALWEAARELPASRMLRRYLPFYRKPSEAHADPRFADLNMSPVANRYRRPKTR